MEAMNIALTLLLAELGPSRRFSDSSAATQSQSKVDTCPSNRVIEIHLSIKQLKGL